LPSRYVIVIVALRPLATKANAFLREFAKSACGARDILTIAKYLSTGKPRLAIRAIARTGRLHAFQPKIIRNGAKALKLHRLKTHPGRWRVCPAWRGANAAGLTHHGRGTAHTGRISPTIRKSLTVAAPRNSRNEITS
jgi:hypothetical protein